MIIKIFGSRGEGKSTVAELIANTLKERGIEVTVTDNQPNSNDLSLEDRLKILAGPLGPLKCDIKTINYARETRPKYAQDFTK